ncbi:suppressor of fused domain protein [Chitinophaga pinensis]|uniref:Riboflavin biosynthesis protein n=1 Tax=Chitinophaga pinensis (strain ATCC 43595 / DSM 2588 / LMG 13176 / NBRC 15968 / NCIMB 11800 / UQM 2034) TaxID=485918 RepID=A0A979G261_CHIPD|nr:suppressor of fused domain protein [Chitinophaga pinensis]ACU59243.1 riboflavin biosynthesis protein [Chitinophaga pinensis DSM 2588]
MTKEEYSKLFTADDAVGWLAIDKQLDSIYPGQEPRHYAPPLHFMVGGEDPIDGTSIYDSEKQMKHLHLVSYGMSQLYYDEEQAGKEFSKWGFEFTFRLKPFAEDEGDPGWAIRMMNNLARYVYKSERWFEPYHFVPANGPIRLETATDIVGLAFVQDPELGVINTPHGEVTFLQMVGLTKKEVERLLAKPQTSEVEKLIDEMREYNPLLITDLDRAD